MTSTSNNKLSDNLFPWLVADIGGSNARFGWIADKATGVEHVRTLPVKDYVDPIAATKAYLSLIANKLNEDYQPPRCAAFAVATAVASDKVAFTNSHWSFSQAAVKAALQLDSFLVLNDFEALALSLPRLQASQLKTNGALPTQHGTLAVIGPGTGLGVASVVETKSGWVAIPGEGGHVTLAAVDEFESAVLHHVRQQYPHVSAERLLSGIGLPVLHSAVGKVMQIKSAHTTSEAIVEHGLSGSDNVCSKTLAVFCAMLGGFAGNVALILGARGGVYIGGGIVPRLGDYFFTSDFRERFEAKGRLRSYLEGIPTVLIIDTLAALSGAAMAIEQHVE
ncbi:glucokinase [Undibacterium sp. GrIS 1.8]|uniref:glucokinase n=1 Tax=Undibacterium sp. GrIS 1.8 TaxID=3143934 RepID=UPI003395D3A3